MPPCIFQQIGSEYPLYQTQVLPPVNCDSASSLHPHNVSSTLTFANESAPYKMERWPD